MIVKPEISFGGDSMSDTRFDEFVRREQQAVQVIDGEPVDWQAEKSLWLQHLEKLFAQVNSYLDPYVADGQVKIAYQPITLNEEHIGPYSAKEMIISIGSKFIKLEPVGTNLIGSKGRVDVLGPGARAQLLLLHRDTKSISDLIHVSVSVDGGAFKPPRPRRPPRTDWTWKIASRPPKREFIDISRENFLNLLLEVSNG